MTNTDPSVTAGGKATSLVLETLGAHRSELGPRHLHKESFVHLTRTLVLSSSLLLGPSAFGMQPDGLDCDEYPEIIPNERCAEWKALNHDGRWFARWNLETGRIEAIYGARDSGDSIGGLALATSVVPNAPPMVDLVGIDRETAKTPANRSALERLAYWYLRENAAILGFVPKCTGADLPFEWQGAHSAHQDGNDGDGGYGDLPRGCFVLDDFRSERGETFETATANEDETMVSVGTGSSVPVFHIELRQIYKELSINKGFATVTVDISGNLVGIRASFHSTHAAGSARPRLTSAQAMESVFAQLEVEGSALVREPVPFLRWFPVEEGIDLVWQVAFEEVSDDDGKGRALLVTVRDRDRRILNAEKLGSGFCPPLIRNVDGQYVFTAQYSELRDGIGNAFELRPPISFPVPDPDCTILGFPERLSEVVLRDLCVYSGSEANLINGHLQGRYTRVTEGVGAQRIDHDFRLSDPLRATIRIDREPNGVAVPDQAPTSVSNLDSSFFDFEDAVPDEQLLDGVMAYYHTDRAARFFEIRYGNVLNRADNVGPDVEVHVNSTLPNGMGSDNSAWFVYPDTVATLGSGTLKFDLSLRFGRGKYFQPVQDNLSVLGATPFDVYTRLDWSRDATIVAHEFTHAMTWDISGLRVEDDWNGIDDPSSHAGRTAAAYHEALADYFGGAINDAAVVGSWVTSPQGGRELISQPTTDPRIYPYNVTGEEHHDGMIIAQALWDVRRRVLELKEQIPLLSFYTAPDRLAYGTMQRVGTDMDSYSETLADALSTDADVFEGRFHYELLAAFASHGIKLDSALAIVQPSRFAVDARGTPDGLPVHARAFLGTHELYIIEFATSTFAFGPLFKHPDPSDPEFNYFQTTNLPGGGGPAIEDLPGAPHDGKNNIVNITLNPDTAELMLRGRPSTPIFMRVTSIDADFFPMRYSHRPGAGMFITNGDDPFTIYVGKSAPTSGCQCALVSGRVRRQGGMTALLVVVTVAFLRRRRSLQ